MRVEFEMLYSQDNNERWLIGIELFVIKYKIYITPKGRPTNMGNLNRIESTEEEKIVEIFKMCFRCNMNDYSC